MSPRRTTIRKACAAWGLACALVLTSCSGGDEQAGGPIPSGPPADPTTSQTTPTVHDGPPELPALAREHTNAGAKAFVRYYIDVLNYADASGDPALLMGIGTQRCQICQILSDAVIRIASAGGGQTGGEWSVRRVRTLPHSGNQANLLTSIHVHRGTTRLTGTGPLHQNSASNALYEIHLLWSGRAWRMSDVLDGS